MSGAQDSVDIRFRMTDGTDIGPSSFPVSTSVADLKENIISQWPTEKENGPQAAKDLKLICTGRILENHKTVGECCNPLCDIPEGIITMHVVVQPPTRKDEKLLRDPKPNKCGCVIL
ncbi:membrane-anchored ubiquitin-fold protein 1-like [Andrographis paniculata]|uniref:membrane-anchored ubiquitin-fold protein 1-like n=1 Tax=Andrographis paniculata TaxID=175694 RepID=UPI0021E8CEC9|nr:membrane-anchored ubiquitin-fold protein 1-like [Andrographis paniculata]